MAVGKEIRTQIRSVENTKKITKAMEMVAASKMRRAQDVMLHARPYAESILRVAGHLSHATVEYRHPYLSVAEEIKRVGIIVITTDKGLCGGLNSNLLREVVLRMKEWTDQGIEVAITAIGSKGNAFFQRMGGEVVSSVTHLGDRPEFSKLIGCIKVITDEFRSRSIHRVYIAYSCFENTMKQHPEIRQLLPLSGELVSDAKNTWDYIYEPDAKSIIDDLLMRYIESVVYEAVLENIASEQSARMVAMKAASDNAKTVIDDLKLVYNKSRQAAITTELSEIISGAAAI